MVANAGGPCMTWYLIQAKLDVLGVAGTTAFFFAMVNAVKVPISIGLGLLNLESLSLAAALALPLAIGATCGFGLAHRIGHYSFERFAAIVAAIAGLALLA